MINRILKLCPAAAVLWFADPTPHKAHSGLRYKTVSHTEENEHTAGLSPNRSISQYCAWMNKQFINERNPSSDGESDVRGRSASNRSVGQVYYLNLVTKQVLANISRIFLCQPPGGRIIGANIIREIRVDLETYVLKLCAPGRDLPPGC
jgi:hypothetical protein